jgi:hypothetical protein
MIIKRRGRTVLENEKEKEKKTVPKEIKESKTNKRKIPLSRNNVCSRN